MGDLGRKQDGAMLLLFVVPLLGLVALALAYQRYEVLKLFALAQHELLQTQLQQAKDDVKNYASQGITQSRAQAPGDLPRPDNFSGGQFPDGEHELESKVGANALCANSQLCLGLYPIVQSSIAPRFIEEGGERVLDLMDPKGELIWYITPRQMFSTSKAIGGDSSGIRHKWPRETGIERILRLHTEQALLHLRADPTFLPAGVSADNFARDDILAVFALAGGALNSDHCTTPQHRFQPNSPLSPASFFDFAKHHLEILPKHLPVKAGLQEKPRLLAAEEQPTLYIRPFPPAGNFALALPRPPAQLDPLMGENGRNASCFNDVVVTLSVAEVLPLMARKIADDIYASWQAFYEFPVFIYNTAGRVALEDDDLTPRMTDLGLDKTPPPFQTKSRKLARRLLAKSGLYRHKDKRRRNANGVYPLDRNVAANDPNAFPVYGLPASEKAFVQWIFGKDFNLSALDDEKIKTAKKASGSRPACPTALHQSAIFAEFEKLSVPNQWWACVTDRRAKTWLVDWFDHRLLQDSVFRANYPHETASIKLFEDFQIKTRSELDALGREIETVYQMTFALRACPNIRFTMEQSSDKRQQHTLKALQQEGLSCH